MRQIKIPKSFTSRSSETLEIYFQDISKEELLSTDEEVRLAQRIRQGDPRALEKLVNANLRFVVSVAKQFQHRGLSLLDLISEGNIGLIKAANRFDETKGFKFISYAVWWIRQSILWSINNYAETIRIPLNKIGDRNKINNARADFEQKMQREPTVAEIAEAIKFTEKEVLDAMNVPAKTISLDASITNEEESYRLLDVIDDPDSQSPDEQVMKQATHIQAERMLATLPSKESHILRLFYGINSGHGASLEEIANSYHLSRERIRQIKDSAIRRLRKKEKSLLRILSN